MTSLPFFNGAALVVETEVATRKPPLDRTAERRASAPAIGVAGALAAAGVVDPLEEGPRDPPSLALPAILEREACAEADQHDPADSIERALDAWSNENVASACHGGRYRSADGPQYSARPTVDRLEICTAATVRCHLSLCSLSLQAQAREARVRTPRGNSHRSMSRCQRSGASQCRNKPSARAPDPGAGPRPAMRLSRCAVPSGLTGGDDAESCCSRETSRIGRSGTSTTCPALRPGVGSAIRPRQVQTRRRSSLTRWAAGSMCLRPPSIHKMSRVLRATRRA